VGSRHQEQNREGGKAQSGQYTTCWAGLLHWYQSRPHWLSDCVDGVVGLLKGGGL
jgi:hypothetical protein